MNLNKIRLNILFVLMILNSSFVFAGAVEDTVITTAVKTALALEQDIPSQNIEVVTQNQIVSLKGKVDTRLQANRAVEVATSVNDVVDVVDKDLVVKDSKSIIVDSLITAKVKGKIKHLHTNKKIIDGYDPLCSEGVKNQF